MPTAKTSGFSGKEPGLRGRIGRLAIGLALVALGVMHGLFGLANFGFVERLPENLDVLIEGATAWIASASLFWGAVQQFRGAHWGVTVLLGGAAFATGMALSVATGASTPNMLLVTLPVLFTGGIASLLQGR